MDARSPRWHRVTPSTFPWEDEAIEFLRERVPDSDPHRAWSNFEFISGGIISEVDVFLLTRKGAYFIEIKSHPGRLTGNQQTWTFARPDGGRSTMANPLLVTDRKAKRIKSLLEARWGKVAGNNAQRVPFIQPVVFLSDPTLHVALAADARAHVYGRDGSPVVDSGALPGIVDAVTKIGAIEANSTRFHQLNTPTTSAVAKALDSIGIKESDHTRRVGEWVLRLDTVTERPGIQDFVADHQHNPGVQRRVRIYSKPLQMSGDQAESLQRAAQREFLAAERIQHPNVVRAVDQIPTELGSAVVFDHHPSAVRLDHWLATHEDLTIDDRLSVLRQLADTMRAVHRRKVTHRALSPGSILVRPGAKGEAPWVVLVTDFSLAGRDHAASTSGTRPGTRTGTRFGLPSAMPGDVDLLADESAGLYCAPELFTEDDPDGVSLDVFSFGAVAYTIVADRPPAESRDAFRQALLAGRGLHLASVVPGVADALHDLVLEATRPVVSERMGSFDDVLAGLDLTEEELTAPSTVTTDPEAGAEAGEIDPLDAKVGDVLGDGAMVRRRLGRGSTAVALLVDRGEEHIPREVVYKVSLGGEADARLHEESRILVPLRHPGVVEAFEEVELGGRPVLVEAVAGRESLADELRRNGTPGIEFLQRWGDDLLDAVRYLEREGRAHRDIKPDNLGVTEVGANKEQHLVLFDFSLAGVASTDLRAGTPPYLEPFLAERPTPRWDQAAELYAAAVTLYEMATGEVPRWGDGRSDPSFAPGEVTLDPVLFDPAAREPLERFFARALRRDPAERFGNAEEMLFAWKRVFDDLEQAGPSERHGEAPAGADEAAGGDRPTLRLPDGLGLDDPVVSLGAAPKVVSALARLEVATVRQLAALVPADVTRAKRISPRVRRRILELRAALLARFGAELAEGARRTTTTDGPATAAGTVRTDDGEAPRLDLDLLVPLLVPPTSGRKSSTQPATRLLLGLDALPDDDGADWASQSAVAAALGVTRQRLGQISPKVRAYWAALPELRSVRDELVDLVADSGGVAAVRELEPLLVDSRGSGLAPADAAQAARAVIRAAVEAEESQADDETPSRLVVRRRAGRVVVAVDGPVDDRSAPDGVALAAYAGALGEVADRAVAGADDVVPQDRAVTLLRAVAPPEGAALTDGRLIRLGAAASQTAGASSALELYPVDLSPVRALRLARQGLAAADSLTVDEVRDRVRSRFPLVDVPDRPELDAALSGADVAVTWDPATEAFRRRGTAVGDLTTMTSVVGRQPTHVVRPVRRSTAPTAEVDPAVTLALDVEGRLERTLAHGGFLALRVATTQGPALRRELARFTADPHGVVPVDLEVWFLDELRTAAQARRITWDKLVAADLAAEGSTDHTNLRILTKEAAREVEQRVLAAGARVVAWNAGVLARYDQMEVIDRLRDRAGRVDSALQTLWLVVFGSTAEAKPAVDGRPVPVLGASEWLDIPTAWLGAPHRHLLPTGTAPKGP